MARTELLRLIPEAPRALGHILSSERGPVEAPVRSEIFGQQRFRQHGRSLGETHRAQQATHAWGNFFPRIRENIAALREAHRYISQYAVTGYDISPAAEWLLDNFHLIEAQLKEIHEGLPRRYFRALPVLLDEPLAGLPRVYGVAWAFVAHTDGAFDEELLTHFLSAYQETRELKLGEIWALPTTLRVVLIENLRRLAERVATAKAAREVANLVCDRIGEYSPGRLNRVLALVARRGVAATFLAQMAQRLQERHANAAGGEPQAEGRDATDTAGGTDAAQAEPDHVAAWLRKALPDPAAAQAQQRADQAADNLSVSNAVTSLRAIGDADWPEIVAETSPLMRLMLTSPVFEAEHPLTRDQTLHGIEQLARRSGRTEVAVAQTLLGLMAGPAPQGAETGVPSHWLHGGGRARFTQALGLHERAAAAWRGATRGTALPLYLGALVLGTAGLVAWMLFHHRVPGPAWMAWLVALLMVFPASEAVVAVVNRLISESARPDRLPRLALAHGIPAEHRVMVVIPCMLTSTAGIDALVRRLELHHLANPERMAQFALLSDWADADAAHAYNDGALLDHARARLLALNARHAPADAGLQRFLLLHRGRRFSESEQRWIGWERKRGKLEQLVAVLATGEGGEFLDLGELSRAASGTRHVLTLDSDTQLPPARLRDLVGVAAHPHNQPRLDASGRRVVGGYGILQPRIATPLPSSQESTAYHWLFAGQPGIDPYSSAASEVYQDVFGEGTFTGKGLLDVRAVHAVLHGRLPQGQVLSHDLLEGSLARCAAVTDLSLVEDAPFHADVAAARVHRWTRGDWQLLPLLLRTPLAPINRWKMFDNLRRSLVAPASLALLVLAAATGVMAPWAALALVAAAFGAGPLMGAVAGLSPSRDQIAKRHFYRQAVGDLGRAVAGIAWHLALLLQQAMLALDAMLRALWRTFVSRRHLLQWTTAAAAQAAASTRLGSLARQHAPVTLFALLLGALLSMPRFAAPGFAALLCLLWAATPVWVWWASRPRAGHADEALSTQERDYLLGVARDTWRFFERCVGPDDNHLPPDNLQTLPHDIVAHRTSPTNIGLYLLAASCARQFGWIGTQELLSRLEATGATLNRLERHRGHFLNWYDTQSGAPLLPMYVSAVDSGNLSGHLLAVSQACRELAGAPEEAAFAPRLAAIAADFTRLAWEADFSFLYHRKRHLFHIGLRVAEQQLDAGFYDLLPSESRLMSLLAIAKGDVPVRHWVSLGRLFYAVGTHVGLRSWSGSMFEYLMPTLVLNEPRGSVLNEACRAALREQVHFAQGKNVPWGISESAYAGSDHTLAYQYSPQGVPRLALRRTPPDDLVVAPYATALAAQVDPRLACANFMALQALGVRGDYGFMEALDFTPGRQSGGERFTPVSTFMAHHQGMSIVALANVLLDGVARRWGMADAHVEAVSLLLHERTPREVSMLDAPSASAPPRALQKRAPGLLREVIPGLSPVEPTQLLSNGRYSVTLRANGAGGSRLGEAGITRSRDDALRDAFGSFFYLRRRGVDEVPVSLTQHPAPDAAAQYQALFHADRACFEAAWPGLHARTTVWVSPEDDIEFRQVELRNLGDAALDVELISAFELTLADPRADEAHPAFSNLFIEAGWQPAHQALMFRRKPRLATEGGLQAAHFLADTDPQVVSIGCQTDRQRWLGRNHTPDAPLAQFEPVPLHAGAGAATGSDAHTLALDTGLDPVCAISVRLRIAPGGKAQLTFATAASDNGATLRAVIDKYRQRSHVQRASLMSATLAGIRLRAIGLGAGNFGAIQSLTTAVVLNLARHGVAARPETAPVSRVCDRRALWRLGISGDRPVVLVTIEVPQGLGLLRTMAQALRVWSWGHVACDLVVLNAEAASYHMALQHELVAMRQRHLDDTGAEANSGSTSFHVLRAEEVSADELSTLRALARLQFHADGRPLLHHVREWLDQHEQMAVQRAEGTVTVVGVPGGADSASAAEPSTGQLGGQFGAQFAGQFGVGGEFRFDVGGTQRPSRPWVNVLANPAFGAQITESGGGYSWGANSRLNQLTGWSNDPVGDPPSEWFLLQDRKTSQAWSVAPSAWGDPQASYRVAHGQGYTSISHRRGDADVATTWCVDPASAVKQVRVRVVNRGHRALQLRVVGIAEWVMGANRADRATTYTAVVDEPGSTALLCTQRDRSAGFGGGTAFLALARPGAGQPGEGADAAQAEGADWTCDRRELFDARGRLVLPDHLGRQAGRGLDPCAALSTELTVAAGETRECVFLLGYGTSHDAARQLAAAAVLLPAADRMARARAQWDTLLGAARVKTPDPLFDVMVNRWLLYQSVSCRLWAKAGFYQAGGATGFRDQLQDSMALAWAAPAMLREQIVTCASRQFPEGDVQHWWHAPLGAGVRTHFSDDLLWLPYACAHYLRATGDASLLQQSVAFLEGMAIPPGAEDAYYTPEVSTQHASVYEHAARAIDRSLRTGAHGLPLMGSGDWNDGMNRVGIEGRGESVWLAWFLCRVVADFAPIARIQGDAARAGRWDAAAAGWREALEREAWDGDWYRRAFFDGGEPLGSHVNVEAQIDLIAQAWSVLSGAAPEARQQQALAAMDRLLVDDTTGLVRLLDPPLARAVPSAGYIQAYPAGVRENGGQYSHAGVWALMAQAQAGNADHAWRYFTYLNPAHRSRHPTQGPAYGIEPYVMAGDVYSQAPYAGRGGWSWYTGAAAWLHRASVESIFGLHVEADELKFIPCLPTHWPLAELTLTRDGRSLRFILCRASAQDAAHIALQAADLPAATPTQLLLPGQALRWRDVAAGTCLVVPLLP